MNVPAGTGPILMDLKKQCISGHTNLLQLSHNGFGYYDCSHKEDVGVECYEFSGEHGILEAFLCD